MSRARDLADLGGSADAGTVTGSNLVINGDFAVAQRGTSSTGTNYQTVDRWKIQNSGDVTQSQEDLTSSDEPYNYGFRKTLKLLNTANASGTSTYTQVYQGIEAQNVACSGWNYTSSSSYITIQFWVKSSLAGTYVSFLRTNDGTSKSYSFEFTLVADTWKKVTYTVSGDSGITIDNDNGIGLDLFIVPYYGTDFTTSGHTDESWQTYDGSNITGDYAQNWKNSSNSTFFITGVKLEVGTTATPFQHESYGETLAKCQRYYYKHCEGTTDHVSLGDAHTTFQADAVVHFPVTMRSAPSLDANSGSNYWGIYIGGVLRNSSAGWTMFRPMEQGATCYNQGFGSMTVGQAGRVITSNASAYMAFDAEL